MQTIEQKGKRYSLQIHDNIPSAFGKGAKQATDISRLKKIDRNKGATVEHSLKGRTNFSIEKNIRGTEKR